jgi:uncharacterized protein
MTGQAHSPFQVPGADGEVIRGDVHLPAADPGGPLPLVLVLHGFKGYKDYGFFPYLTQALADVGLAAVRFNFAHSGIDDDPSTFGRPDLFERDAWSKQLFDVGAVIAAAESGELPHAGRMDLDRIGVIGHSRGGFVALVAGGSAGKRIKAVVSLAAPSSGDMPEDQKQVIREEGYIISPSSRTSQDLRIGREWIDDLDRNAGKLDVLAAVGRMTAPLLIVHGSNDQSVPVSCAGAIAAAYPGDAQTLILDGAGHTFDCTNPFTAPTPALDQLTATATAFLTTHLSGCTHLAR